MKKLIIAFLILASGFRFCSAQDMETVFSDINRIDDLLLDISEYYNDADKFESNKEILEVLREMLNRPESVDYPWDSLKRVSYLVSEDEKLRIFTWNIMLDDLSHKCFGFIQLQQQKNEVLVYELKDFFFPRDEMERKYASYAEWYGAIYYDIIQKPITKKQNYYTLLGWRGVDGLVQQKVIETLEFDRNGLPVFGNNRIRKNRTKERRIIFNYSLKTQMILRYNEKGDFIVADHLSPSNPKLIGHFEYYGPDYSYDAFEFDYGKWYFKSDIDPEVAIRFKRDPEIEKIRERKPSENF